jgi:ParB family chromosome partitioning protein
MAFQGDSIYWVEVEKIVPNPFQPRREFDQHKLQELADSIRMYGVLQPLTVTRNEIQREDGTFYSEYELIAGERRLRASRLAGIAQVPVIIRDGEQSEQEKLELAIIENLQREDLNAVDRAIAFRQLADQFGLSHGQVAQKVGRSREYVSNSIRLLALPEHMLDALRRNDMMEGHARTLLMLTDRPQEQEVVYKEILLKKLSVREVERIVRKIATDKIRKKNPGEFDANLIEFEKKFTETLGTRVQILKTDFGGKLTIDYFSEDDLASLLGRIKDEVQIQPATTEETVAILSAATPLAMEASLPDTSGLEIPVAPVVLVEPMTHYAEPESWSEESIEATTPGIAQEITPTIPLAQSVPEYAVPLNNWQPVPPPMVTSEQLETTAPVIAQETMPTPSVALAEPEQPMQVNNWQPVPPPLVTPEPSVAPAWTPAVVTSAVIPPVQPMVPPQEAPVAAPKEEDESSLYSIRNFSV